MRNDEQMHPKSHQQSMYFKVPQIDKTTWTFMNFRSARHANLSYGLTENQAFAWWMRERDIHQKTIKNDIQIHPTSNGLSIENQYSKKVMQQTSEIITNKTQTGITIRPNNDQQSNPKNQRTRDQQVYPKLALLTTGKGGKGDPRWTPPAKK